MGDKDHRVSLLAEDVLQQLPLGVGVERTRSLIEEHHRTVSQQRTRYGDALSLSFAQSAALLAALRVEARGQLAHEVGAGRMQRLQHILVGGIEIAQPEVVAYGAAQQRVALRHVDQVAAQAGRHRAGVAAVVDFHLSLLWREQCQDEAHQRGLARTGLTQHRRAAAWQEVERQIADDGGILVGVAHVAHPDAARLIHIDGVALLLQRVLLQLHESLGSRKHRHKLRHKLRQRACRTLYLVHQLQEGRHAAKRQRASRHAQGGPEECHQIAQGEAEVHDEVRHHAERRALHHLVAQFALRRLQAVHHVVVALQRLDEHAVLNGLLQHALHLRVARAHLAGEPPHASHVYLAQAHKHGDDGHSDESQHPVHREQIAEGAHEERCHRQRAGYHLGEEVHDVRHVELQSVEHVARVAALLAVPLRAQDAVEHVLLHAVLRLDAQDVLDPDARDVEGKVGQDECRHDAHGHVERPFVNALGHLDGMLHRPHLSQRHHHRQQSDAGIQCCLQPVASPRAPQPFQDAPRRIFL